LKVFVQLKAFGFQIAIAIAVDEVVGRAYAGGDFQHVELVVDPILFDLFFTAEANDDLSIGAGSQ